MTAAPGPATGPRPSVPQYAQRYETFRLPPIPVKKNSKVPSIKWAEITVDNPADFTNHDGNVGIKLGEFDDPDALFPSYVFALDIDVKNGDGLADLETLQATHGALPATWTATTPSGGRHLLFRTSTAVRNQQGAGNRLSANIDIRGEGGYIVTAPSTIDGEPYRWERSPWETEIADAPDWLIDLLTAEPEQPAPKPTPSPSSHDNESAAEYLKKNWDWPQELERQGWVFHHSDGDDTYWTRPGKPTSEGHSAVLHPDGVLVIWTTQIPEALRRIAPPTQDGSGISVTPFYWYSAYDHDGDMSRAASVINEARRKAEMSDAEALFMASTPQTSPESAQNVLTPAQQIKQRLLTSKQLRDLPPLEPLVDGFFYRDTLCIIYGPPEGGKSFIAIDLALTIASELDNWHGHPCITGSVIYITAEGASGLWKRQEAWLYRHQVDDQVVWHPGAINVYDTSWASGLREVVEELQPVLVIVDTLHRNTDGADENSSLDMGVVIGHLDQIRQASQAAIVVIHHTGKDKTRGGRGSSSLRAAVDSEFEVTGNLNGQHPRTTLKCTKQKDVEHPKPIVFSAETVFFSDDPDDKSLHLKPLGEIEQFAGNDADVISMVRRQPGITVKEIAESGEVACTRSTIYRILVKFENAGHVTKNGDEWFIAGEEPGGDPDGGDGW